MLTLPQSAPKTDYNTPATPCTCVSVMKKRNKSWLIKAVRSRSLSAHNACTPPWPCSLREVSILWQQQSSEAERPQWLTSQCVFTAGRSPAMLRANRISHLTRYLFSSHNAWTAYSNVLLIPLSCTLSLPFHCSPIPSIAFMFLHSLCARSPDTGKTTKQEFCTQKTAGTQQAELPLDKPLFQMEGQTNPGQSERHFRVLSRQSQWFASALAAKSQVYSISKLRPRWVTWIHRLQFYTFHSHSAWWLLVSSYWQNQNQLSHHCLAGAVSFTHYLDLTQN